MDSIAAEDHPPKISDELISEVESRSHRMATDSQSVSSWDEVKFSAGVPGGFGIL